MESTSKKQNTPKLWYWGELQNCVNDRDLKLGLSVGYKFTLF